MTMIEFGAEVTKARVEHQPVILLDAALLTYGQAYPANTEAALRLQSRVCAKGVAAAFAAMIEGQILAGLTTEELHELGLHPDLAKIGPADMAVAIARKMTGILTVGALLIVARNSGIDVIGTGGLGGVHRGMPEVIDISSDVAELSRSAVVVVCSGAKAILDLPNTVEMFETLGIPVLGFEVDSLPGYWSRETGLAITARVDSAAEVAAVFAAQRGLKVGQGLLVAKPLAAELAMEGAWLEARIVEAMAQARESAVRGKALTPFLQKHLQKASGGETVDRTLRLLEDNSLLAADIALAMGRS